MQNPKPIILQHAIAADHPDLPGTATGPAGVIIPNTTLALAGQASLRTGGGVSTVPVAIYARDRFNGSTWYLIDSVANVDALTGDVWTFNVPDPQLYDMVAAYVTGSAGGPFTLDVDVVSSEYPLTSAELATIGTTLESIDTKATTRNATLDEIKETQIERYLEIDRFNSTAGFTVVGSASGIATTTTHVPHEDKALSLTYDKDGANVVGGYQKTISSVDASEFEGQTLVTWQLYISSLADIDYTWVRLGTDASNYTEWRVGVDNLSAGWNRLQVEAHGLNSQVGAGAIFSAITYVAMGIATSLAGDTLAGVVLDYCKLLSLPNVATAAGLTVETGNIANQVRVTKVGNASNGTWPTDIGAADNGTPRVALSNDSTVLPKPDYTDTQMLTNAAADNGVPTTTDGTALQSDTVSALISVVANADVTNADINLWAREKGTDVWFLIPGGAMVDLQAETDDRWARQLPNIGLYASRVYVEIDNYADGGSGTINAYLRESTL